MLIITSRPWGHVCVRQFCAHRAASPRPWRVAARLTRLFAPCSGSFGACVRPAEPLTQRRGAAQLRPPSTCGNPAQQPEIRSHIFWTFLYVVVFLCFFKASKCAGAAHPFAGAGGGGGRARSFTWVCGCSWRFWRRWVPVPEVFTLGLFHFLTMSVLPIFSLMWFVLNFIRLFSWFIFDFK